MTLRGERLPDEPGRAYYVMYKPRGYITGREDPQGRRSVLDLVAHLPVRVEARRFLLTTTPRAYCY